MFVFFFQAEDGIRDLVRSRGLGDVYKRQLVHLESEARPLAPLEGCRVHHPRPGPTYPCSGTWNRSQLPRYPGPRNFRPCSICLLYTSDAADERSSVDLGGRRIIKKKKTVTAEISGRLEKTTES